jgi:hypothetical protein
VSGRERIFVFFRKKKETTKKKMDTDSLDGAWSRSVADVWDLVWSRPPFWAQELLGALSFLAKKYGQTKLCQVFFSVKSFQPQGLIGMLFKAPCEVELLRGCLKLLEQPLTHAAQTGLDQELGWLAGSNSPEPVLKMLLDCGAHPLHKIHGGRTALHAAASHPASFKFLAAWCANTREEHDVDTLVDLGQRCTKHPELVYALRIVLRTLAGTPQRAVEVANRVWYSATLEGQLILHTFCVPGGLFNCFKLLQSCPADAIVMERFYWDLRWRYKEGGPLASPRFAAECAAHGFAALGSTVEHLCAPFSHKTKCDFPLELQSRSLWFLWCAKRLSLPTELAWCVLAFAIARTDAWAVPFEAQLEAQLEVPGNSNQTG